MYQINFVHGFVLWDLERVHIPQPQSPNDVQTVMITQCMNSGAVTADDTCASSQAFLIPPEPLHRPLLTAVFESRC